jgi:DNA-binding NtrC family response regulator
MIYRLSIELGGRTERRNLKKGEHVVGSHRECGIPIFHPTVSRRHARITVSRDGVEVQDLGSRNGTWLEGARLIAPVKIAPGSRLRFGTVQAVLEELVTEDLEPAVILAAPAAPAAAPPAPDDSPPTTASTGSLRDLIVEELPGMLDLLAAHAGPVRMAQAVGHALFKTLPCLRAEVRSRETEDGRSGILFTATRSEPAPSSPSARWEEGPCTIEVFFSHETQVRGFLPIVAALARLIAMTDRGGRQPSAARGVPPPLPDPPTVVPEVRRIYEQAARLARGDVSVLIQGESGTGKEVLARYLHNASARTGGALVALNCAALPRDLLEAELFGIEEKVATGVAQRPGKFEMADGGTLFLDEIGDMAPETQARILRVLQEGEVYRIGATRPRPARARILAATNRDLGAMLAEGTFRTDLYHRIADWKVTLPPLRRRKADIPNLAASFLAGEAERRGVAIAGISRAALALLEAYDWPGNIRQLQREMARGALFLEDGQLLETSHLDESIRQGSRSRPQGLRERLEEIERQEIQRALAAAGSDVGAAAAELGIGRSTLYRRMIELGIERTA